MTHTSSTERAAVEFSRTIEVAQLKGGASKDFDIGPDTGETVALCALLGVRKLSKVHFKGFLKPFGKSEWELRGHLGATIVQNCVVTLVPVTTRIETDVHRLFVREIVQVAEVEIDAQTDIDIELLGPLIDIGQIATEELALATPEYPRAAGAELPQIYSDPGNDSLESLTKPFDALRLLRDRLPE